MIWNVVCSTPRHKVKGFKLLIVCVDTHNAADDIEPFIGLLTLS